MGHVSDEEDFGDDKSVDDCEGVVDIADVVLFQQDHGVGGEGAEEEGQVDGDGGEIFEFVHGLLYPGVGGGDGRGCGNVGGHSSSPLLRGRGACVGRE